MMKPTCYVYSGSRAYPGPWPKMFRCWSTEPVAWHTGSGSYIMSIKEYNKR